MIVNIDAWICYSFKHLDHLPVFIKKPLGCLFTSILLSYLNAIVSFLLLFVTPLLFPTKSTSLSGFKDALLDLKKD